MWNWFKWSKIQCFDLGYFKRWRKNRSRVVELEKDLATIYKAGGKVGCCSPGLIHQVLKVSSKITVFQVFQVQILHCTNLGWEFYLNNPAFYESIPVMGWQTLCHSSVPLTIPGSSLGAGHSCAERAFWLKSMFKQRTSNSALILQVKQPSHSHNLTSRPRPGQMMNSLRLPWK